jgi:hypothetical protein
VSWAEREGRSVLGGERGKERERERFEVVFSDFELLILNT